MKKMLYVAAVLALVACDKKAEQVPAAPAAEGQAQVDQDKQARRAARRAERAARRAAGGAAAQAAPVDPASLLTEEKIKGFIIYHNGIAGMAGEAVGAAGSAAAKSGGDQDKMQKEMARDKRINRIAAAGNAALAQSGLTYPEVGALTNLLSSYYIKRMFALDAKAALEKNKGGGILADMHKKQLEEAEAAHAEFEKKYGKAAMAVVDAHEKEYLEVQQAMLKAVFKKPKKK